MSLGTGGICLNVTNMEQGVALFEREAILHLHSRPPLTTPLPTIVDANSLTALQKNTKLVEDIDSKPAPAVVNQKSLKRKIWIKLRPLRFKMSPRPLAGIVRSGFLKNTENC